MVKAQNKTQNTKQVQATESKVQGYFLNIVKTNGYTIKKYNQLAEQSVQLNGKIKLYFVPLRNGNLKLCLQGVKLPEASVKGLEILNQNTYPNKYSQRVYFKNANLTEVQEIIDNIISQVIPPVATK